MAVGQAAALLSALALFAGGVGSSALADADAPVADAAKKCKRKKPSTPPVTPPTATAASLSISPTAVNFTPGMPIAIGGSTLPQTFTVTNSGGSPSGPLSATITGANPMQFAITSNNCVGMQLAAFSTCFINARYQNALIGTQTAALTVTGVPGGTATATLSGSGTI